MSCLRRIIFCFLLLSQNTIHKMILLYKLLVSTVCCGYEKNNWCCIETLFIAIAQNAINVYK